MSEEAEACGGEVSRPRTRGGHGAGPGLWFCTGLSRAHAASHSTVLAQRLAAPDILWLAGAERGPACDFTWPCPLRVCVRTCVYVHVILFL